MRIVDRLAPVWHGFGDRLRDPLDDALDAGVSHLASNPLASRRDDYRIRPLHSSVGAVARRPRPVLEKERTMSAPVPLIQKIEKQFIRPNPLPEFRAGDTVKVWVKIPRGSENSPAGVRGSVHQALARQRASHLYRAQDFLRRRGRAHLRGQLSQHRQGRGDLSRQGSPGSPVLFAQAAWQGGSHQRGGPTTRASRGRNGGRGARSAKPPKKRPRQQRPTPLRKPPRAVANRPVCPGSPRPSEAGRANRRRCAFCAAEATASSS